MHHECTCHDSVTETALKTIVSSNEVHATNDNFDLEAPRMGVCKFRWKGLKVTVAGLGSVCVWVVHCGCLSGCTIELRTDSALNTLMLMLMLYNKRPSMECIETVSESLNNVVVSCCQL